MAAQLSALPAAQVAVETFHSSKQGWVVRVPPAVNAHLQQLLQPSTAVFRGDFFE